VFKLHFDSVSVNENDDDDDDDEHELAVLLQKKLKTSKVQILVF